MAHESDKNINPEKKILKRERPASVPDEVSTEDFWAAVEIVEKEKSGNPKEYKYAHIYPLDISYKKATASGEYKPETEKIIEETLARLPKLIKIVEQNKEATFTN